MRRRPQWLAFLVNPSELCHLSADRQRCWDAVHSIIHSRFTIVHDGMNETTGFSTSIFAPKWRENWAPGPSGRPEATSVTCGYSMQLSTSLWRTLNCTCQVTVTQPRHSIFIIRQKLQNNGRKLSIRLSGSASPVLGSSFPHPYPLPCCDLATYSCLTHGLSWF